MKTKPRSYISVLFIGLLILLGVESTGAQTDSDVIDRLIAIVGDEIILESEVYQNAQSIALQQGTDLLRDPNKFQQLKEQVLQEMINQKVLLAKAREDSVFVEPREIDRELENRLQTIINNVGGEKKLEEMYGYSIRRIRRDFRSSVEENLLVERVKYQYLQNIKVTRSEIEKYFNDHPEEFPEMQDAVEIAHILRETGGSGLADARALGRADSIYNAIKGGTPFDSLALWFSQDKGTAKNYGSIGWTQAGDLVTDYEEAAYALKKGEISRPVRTRFGYHIIRMDDRREERIATSHILIIPEVTEIDEQPVIDMLMDLRERAINGENFGELADAYSQDLESAKREGYLGWFALQDMPASFKSEIEHLQAGEVSKPFKTQYGYHIAKLISRRAARKISLDQDWELVSQQVLSAKREREYTEWLDGLKARYYIEIKKS